MKNFLAPISVITALTVSDLHAQDPQPFGKKFPNLDGMATGKWWTKTPASPSDSKGKKKQKQFISLDVPRDQVVAFAVYAHENRSLKLTAQLYPLKPGEPHTARLEFKNGGKWKQAATAAVHELGWSAHFRVDEWDNSKDVPYRVRHGAEAIFSGLIRKDPVNKDEIIVANLSCNSSRTPGERPQIIKNLLLANPDLLFFAGDQTYHHTQHTAGWIQFGLQFRELLKDRPTITIPDDHDIGQGNLWGENGIKASSTAGHSGGYFYPAKYVNMVQRQQTWHLPDAYDSNPVERGITVYYTRIRVGSIDFAIIEDRKFKSGPNGKIPKMGPRPDHINNPKYNRKSVDVPGLKLLGERQLKFLRQWGQDWTGARMKAVLSQTAFCGAVHLHGTPKNRLLADLDSNAWPQTGRNNALREIRRAWATHLCGDQHLAVVVKHGIESPGDGPMAFTSPALVNTIYGRWWHPIGEKPGANAIANSSLPWTGDYRDGLGNHLRMLAYANPKDRSDQKQRADGYGIVRFNKSTATITFECWPRFSDSSKGEKQQFPGWPISFNYRENDGRRVVGKLPALKKSGVVQVINETNLEILYTTRAKAGFQPPVYSKGTYTVKFGSNTPEKIILRGHSAG
ncbi:MAG: metallophosphoesterase family protein [Verrucomicrobiales bacterium]